jgi:hypothetical protein
MKKWEKIDTQANSNVISYADLYFFKIWKVGKKRKIRKRSKRKMKENKRKKKMVGDKKQVSGDGG